MAVILIDGFDMYNGTGANTGLQAKWVSKFTVNNVAGTFSLTTGRFADQALRMSGTNGATNAGATARVLPSSYSSLAIGSAFRVNTVSLVGAQPSIFQFREGTTYHVHLRANTDGSIDVLRASSISAGTVLGTTAPGVLLSNTWHFIEAEVVISDTVGRVTLYVDSTQVLNLTGQDTKNGGTGVIDTINLTNSVGAGTTNPMDFDDLYVVDAATKLGERRVETLRPASDSSVVWTPNSGVTNFSRVNEAQVDGDTTYVQASNVGDRDLYALGPLSSTPATIDAVQVSSFGEKTDATARSIYNSIQSSGTNSDGSAFALAASYAKFERIVANDPNGGGAWTASRVNGLLIGPKIAV